MHVEWDFYSHGEFKEGNKNLLCFSLSSVCRNGSSVVTENLCSMEGTKNLNTFRCT